MADNTITYREDDNKLQFSPFSHTYTKNSLNILFPFYTIGNIDTDEKKGYVYIKPILGNIKLQIKAHTYYSIFHLGKPLYELFNSASNYELIRVAFHKVDPTYKEVNLFKNVEDVVYFRNHQDIFKYYFLKRMLFAIVYDGINTYNIFIFKEINKK